MRTRHFLAVLSLIWLAGCSSVSEKKELSAPGNAAREEMPPLAVLETFLGHLAAGQFDAAYKLVAPSSKENGDPIAYNAALDYASFLKELQPPKLETWGEDTDQPTANIRDKFKGYELGKSRWEDEKRFRVWVTFQKWDRDEVLIVHEDGSWYIADPIHIIR